jgi:2-hydroxy-3-keto-5-methylthiopentenyl-1-phosphate phosphatase
VTEARRSAETRTGGSLARPVVTRAGERAAPVPRLEPGSPPFAVLIDFDGTVALADVGDAIMAAHVPGDWEAEEAAWEAGLLGSRQLMEREVALMPPDPDALRATAEAQPLDTTFPRLVEAARRLAVPLEVVSDGFGFFIEPALGRLGIAGVPVVTARFDFSRDGRPRIEWPNGDAACFVCGTCKRDRVLAHRAAGRRVVFVGDGASDRYAAAYADVVFAKRSLLRICLENGWAFLRWTELQEVTGWLESAVAAWRADGTALPPTERPFICGAEVWGPGRIDPPAPPERS